MDSKNESRLLYLKELIGNLRWTSLKFYEAIKVEGSDRSVIGFHLRRAKEGLELSHSHLSQIWRLVDHWRELGSFNGTNSLPEFEFNPTEYDDRLTDSLVVSLICLFFLILIMIMLGFANYKLYQEARGMTRQLRIVTDALSGIEESILLYDQRVHFELNKLCIKVSSERHQGAKLDWHCEKVELRANVDQMRKERDEALRMRYLNELIPVLLGARGNTPVERLRCAIFGDIEYPIVGKDRIKEFLGIPRPPSIDKFEVQDATDIIGAFLPATRPYGDVAWLFHQKKPSPLHRREDSVLSLPQLASPPCDASPELQRFQSLRGGSSCLFPDNWLRFSWKEQGTEFVTSSQPESQKGKKRSIWAEDFQVSPILDPMEAKVDTESLGLAELGEGSFGTNPSTFGSPQRPEPPWTPPYVESALQASVHQGGLDYFKAHWMNLSDAELDSSYLKVKYERGEELLFKPGLVQLATTAPPLSSIFTEFVEKENPWKFNSVGPACKISEWKEIGLSTPMHSSDFASLAPTLRGIFTTDQDTECSVIHVPDSVCGVCFKRVLCASYCAYCNIAVQMVLEAAHTKSLKGNFVPLEWNPYTVVDILYYQLLGLTKYPAAVNVKFPAHRGIDSPKYFESTLENRLKERKPFPGFNRYYNADSLCLKCGDNHLIQTLKKEPQVLDPVNKYSLAEPKPTKSLEDPIERCPPPDQDQWVYEPYRGSIGRSLCLLNWSKYGDSFPYLQLAVVISLKSSGWRAREWPWQLEGRDFGSWPAVFAGWKPGGLKITNELQTLAPLTESSDSD